METPENNEPYYGDEPWNGVNSWATFISRPWWEGQYQDLDYRHEPFNDQEMLTTWRSLGYTGRMTGDMYDMRQPEPEFVKHWRQVIPMDHWSWSLYRMMPGDVLPAHRDTYENFRRIYRVQPGQTIRRYIVFLEPWKSGHYFEIQGRPLVGWLAGAAVFWYNDTEHAAANLGSEPRYTLQITGVVDENLPIFILDKDGSYPKSQ
jgi:hypothetical protein